MFDICSDNEPDSDNRFEQWVRYNTGLRWGQGTGDCCGMKEMGGRA